MVFQKKIITIIYATVVLISSSVSTQSQGYNIRLRVEGAAGKETQLAYYQGDKQFVVQNSKFDKTGNLTFEGKDTLPPGIYFIVIGKSMYFDVLIRNQQHFSMRTDTLELINSMKIKGSSDNEIFFDYQRKVQKIKIKIAEKENNIKRLNEGNDSVEIYKKEIEVLNSESLQIAESIQQQYPNSYLAKLLKAMALQNVDDFEFSDGDLLRTPFYHNMVRLFIKKNIEKGAEYIKYQTARLLDTTKLPVDNYRYIATYLLNFYSTFYKVGIDDVFVFIADNYFLPDKAKWLNSNYLVQIKERRDFLAQSLPGSTAQDLTVESASGEFYSLQQVGAKYTLLYFWSVDCGHCSKSSEILKQNFEALIGKSIEIFAVNIDKDKGKWLKKTEEMEIPWVNCFDPNETSGFRNKYYVYGTPLLYLIDSKKIIAKRAFGEEEIGKLIEGLIK